MHICFHCGVHYTQTHTHNTLWARANMRNRISETRLKTPYIYGRRNAAATGRRHLHLCLHSSRLIPSHLHSLWCPSTFCFPLHPSICLFFGVEAAVLCTTFIRHLRLIAYPFYSVSVLHSYIFCLYLSALFAVCVSV